LYLQAFFKISCNNNRSNLISKLFSSKNPKAIGNPIQYIQKGYQLEDVNTGPMYVTMEDEIGRHFVPSRDNAYFQS